MRTAEEQRWMQISEFGTGFHYISNTGRIVRAQGVLKTKNGYRGVPQTERKLFNRAGYLSIPFKVNGITKNFPVHILVAKYFVPNPLKKPCVNHKDGNKLNNNYWNLEWVTYSENESHSYSVLGKKANKTALGKTGEKSKLSKKVKCIETGTIYASLGAAAKDNNVSRSLICKVVNGKQKTANGKTFQYLN